MSAESKSDSQTANPPVDRLLKAAAPAVSEELARILQEQKDRLEAEATVRLRKALLDQESELQAKSENDQNRVRAETTTEVTNRITAELETGFQSKLEGELRALEERLREEAGRMRADLEGQAEQARSEWKRERGEIVEEGERWRTLAQFHRRVGEASSQSEILRKFLRAAGKFSTGAALYLNKADGLALWNSEGNAVPFPEVISEETKDPEWFWAPVVIRSKMVAVVCATGVQKGEPMAALIDGLRRSVEYLGLRMQVLGSGDALEPSDAPPEEPASDPVGANARRLARTLVSGIKLGHEQEVIVGRARFDLYARLQVEIDEGRRAYLRGLPSPAPSRDFFHDELVKILADNDPGRLGAGYPGPG